MESQEEENEIGTETVFEEAIIALYFLELMKDIKLWILEIQEMPNKIENEENHHS